MSIVLQIDKDYVIAVAGGGLLGLGQEKVSSTTAMVQSEIADGDEDPIELWGHYREDKSGIFEISRIRANGLSIDL